MAANTMSFALPKSMRYYIEDRVRTGQYRSVSEYLLDLIRQDQAAQADARLRSLIVEGLDSGPAQPLTQGRLASLRAHAGCR